MTVSPGTDVAVTELLATLAGLPGLLRACVFEVETGTVCMTVGSDVEPPASLLAHARQAHAASGGDGDATDDVIVTSSGAHHLLRAVPAAAGDVLRTVALWVYVELDGGRADLPLARRRLAHATHHDDPGPSPTNPPDTPSPVVQAAATPALAMLPPLDDSWGPIGAAARAARARRTPAVAAPLVPAASAAPPSVGTAPPPLAPSPRTPPPLPPPDPPPVAPTEPASDEPPPASVPAPRRVPVTGRPLALVEPPTVPPPPPPGVDVEPDDTTVETPALDRPSDPSPPDAPTTEVAATTTHPLPTRRAAAPAPPLPEPRSPERTGGWDTDTGTLRRLVVTLRRLA